MSFKLLNDVWGMNPKPYFGSHIDWGAVTPQSYSNTLGRIPAVFGDYVQIAQTLIGATWMRDHINKLDNVYTRRGTTKWKPIYSVALMPSEGFDQVSDAAIQEFANICYEAQQKGVNVMVRYAHEMNGEWYAYGKQPEAFKQSWIRVRQVIKAKCPNAVMVWAPNVYDNRLTYEEYYPGDQYVDWVGLSLYHFGYVWPYQNENPLPTQFESALTANNSTGPLNFYKTYARDRGKPLVISETSAPLHVTEPFLNGATEMSMKQAWWRQLYSTGTFNKFPQLKMIMWFEYKKVEDDGTQNDHRLVTSTSNNQLLPAFKNELPWSYMVFNADRA